jgi:hypothetical protein
MFIAWTIALTLIKRAVQELLSGVIGVADIHSVALHGSFYVRIERE